MLLVETTFSQSPRVDREAGVIRNVKVLGRTSKNGREYSDPALNDVVRIYEGVKVRVDHPPKNEPGKERQFVDAFGRLEKLRRGDDGVYADMPYKKAHPLAELVCESAERFPTEFGLSHNAEGTVVQKDGKVIVESITRARGVDVVDSPASTQGIFESKNEGEPSVELAFTETIKVSDIAAGSATDHPIHALLEMDGMGAMTVDVPAGSDHDKKLKAALEKMILAIFRDDSIDSTATAKKISASLKHYDKLIDLGSPGDGKTVETPMESNSGATAMTDEEKKKADAEAEAKKVADAKLKESADAGTTGDALLTESQFRSFMESVVAENNQLKTELAKERGERLKMEREVKARRLLESKGREANPFTEDGRRNVETLLKIESESIWSTLIDSWPSKTDRKRPARTGSVMESRTRTYHSPIDVHDGKSLAAAIFE